MTRGSDPVSGMAPLHWMLQVLQDVDVGLVVFDRDYRIELWNGFMENYSGIAAHDAKGQVLFELFPELPEHWLRHKAETVFMLGNRAFTVWEQRPNLFPFRHYRPITGPVERMYQNITMIPLAAMDGGIGHICLIVYDVSDVAVSQQALTQANSELARLSRTDGLTGLNNRGCWEERLAQEFARYRRTGEPVSLVMLDIDHFKQVNDCYGHPAGDEVIRALARLLSETMRETDVGGRYGGEEFGVILVGTSAAAARFFAERLRRRVEAAVVPIDGQELRFTVSLGIAELDQTLSDYVQWLERADKALYAAKEAGRNRSHTFGG